MTPICPICNGTSVDKSRGPLPYDCLTSGVPGGVPGGHTGGVPPVPSPSPYPYEEENEMYVDEGFTQVSVDDDPDRVIHMASRLGNAS